MIDYAQVLGVSPDADLATIKAAYRAKLKEFPAHAHPEEFKAVRAAYEALKKPGQGQLEKDFFKPKPLNVVIDPTLVESLRARLEAKLNKSLEELIKLSF